MLISVLSLIVVVNGILTTMEKVDASYHFADSLLLNHHALFIYLAGMKELWYIVQVNAHIRVYHTYPSTLLIKHIMSTMQQ